MPDDNYPPGTVSRYVTIELECLDCGEIVERRALDELGTLDFINPKCDCGSVKWEIR